MGSGTDAKSSIDAASGGGDAADGTATRQQCTSSFGKGLSSAYGRLDGYLVSIVPPGSTSGCNDDAHHVHLQVLMGGGIYDVAVNVSDSKGGGSVYTNTKDVPLPDGAWSEGWHPGVSLDYVQTLGLHSTDFTAESEPVLAADVESELAQVNHISVFGTGYNASGTHLIHRKGSGHDGAIASNPLSPNAHLRVFHFGNQSF